MNQKLYQSRILTKLPLNKVCRESSILASATMIHGN